ncbi:hypothetical protein V6Z12_D08G177600 [Gossypium hirsutum]
MLIENSRRWINFVSSSLITSVILVRCIQYRSLID